MKLYLIGYMAVGKSTLGKRLSNALELPFIDLDAVVEQAAGSSIAALFASHGEAHFREMEHRALIDFAESNESGLLSTGGGTPLHFNNMELMLRSGTVVWLRLPPKMIVSRLLVKPQKRPLIAHLNPDELLDYVTTHLEVRSAVYCLAHFELDTKEVGSIDLTELLERIKRQNLENNANNEK
jgi:shikimate kinase